MDLLRDNIRHLMAGRTENAVALGAGVDQTWLNRILNPDRPDGTKNPRTPGLTKLAAFFGVTLNELMFKDLTETVPVASQPAGSEQSIVDAAVKLVRYYEDMVPKDLVPPETYPRRLYIGMLIAREEGADSILDGSNLAEAARHFAARLRAVG